MCARSGCQASARCCDCTPAYKIGQEVLLDGYTNSRRYYNGKRGNIVAVPDAARTYYVVELWDTRRRTYARPPNMSLILPTVTAEGAAARALHWCHNLEMCIKHYLQGGEVQQKTRGSDDETYVDAPNPSWGSSYEYRIKPKPKFVYHILDGNTKYVVERAEGIPEDDAWAQKRADAHNYGTFRKYMEVLP